ncbi:MAG: hypothetical protein RLZZ299_1567 [Pseudomonadota bacterium]|jgi:hypothetical protein
MKTGDIVRDGQGRTYRVEQALGRGAWGRCWGVRRESDDAALVLKVALGPEDLRAEAPAALAALSREAVLEQARLYETTQSTFLPRVQDRVSLPDGRPGYLVPRYATSLERKLVEGMSFGALVDVLLQVVRLIRQLEAVGGAVSGVHGGLRPGDILFNERAEIVLTDVATPAARRVLALTGKGDETSPWLPPELAGASEGAWTPTADTWALSVMLWRTVVGGEPVVPRGGLDKTAQVATKDRLLERMKLEESNPRFHTRLAERTSVLLGRALSRDTMPSPPYRFHRLEEFHARLDEILTLVRPRVTQVGKIMLDRGAQKPWFTTDESVSFSSTVACTPGVEAQDEVGVGIIVVEIDRDQRVKDLDLGYTVEKHPSGRYRFAFQVGAMPPGRYRARAAFAVRESPEPPATADVEFTVRAAPGWVPRPDATPGSAALLMHPSAAETRVDERTSGAGFPRPSDVPAPPPEPTVPDVTEPEPAPEPSNVTRIPPQPPPFVVDRERDSAPGGGVTQVPVDAPARRVVPVDRSTGPGRAEAHPRFADAPGGPSHSGPRPAFGRDGDPPTGSGPRPVPAGPRPEAPSAPAAAPAPAPAPAPVPEPAPTAREAEPEAEPTADIAAEPTAPMAGRVNVRPGTPVREGADGAVEAASRPGAPRRPELELDPPARSRAASWSAAPLRAAERDLEADEAPLVQLEDDDTIPASTWSRMLEQFRTDPYLAVMGGIGIFIVSLLAILLLMRN